MAIRKVARLGHPVLRQVARDLSSAEIRSPEVRGLIADMVDTMGEYGGIGLAAPQVHESLQLAIIQFDQQSSRYPGLGEQPLTVFINPRITVIDSEKQGFWEGCLSVPDLRGFVERPSKIEVEFLDENAAARKMVAEGFLATVIQHELDHLNGVLFVDRLSVVPGRTPLAFLDEYRKYVLPIADAGDVD